MDCKIFMAAIPLLAVAIVALIYLTAAWRFRRLRGRLYQELKNRNTGNALKEVTDIEEGVWERFLPRKLLEILGVGEWKLLPEKLLEEQVELHVGIININLSGFQAGIHSMEAKEAYRLINRVLSCCIPSIHEAGGSITRFQDAGVTALFTDDVEEGLKAAVSICEKLRKLPDRDRMYGQTAIGMCFGEVMFGVVGHDERMSVLTLSSHTGLGEFLQQMAPKYYARILVAESYLEHIPNFQKKYNSRFLGYIRMKSTGAVEKIYDIFDGDDASVRNQKRKTRMVFERGTTLFLEGAYTEARRHFIEVLKTDRYDRAAMEYVLLCDKYAGETENSGKDICIEEYK